MTSKLQLEDLLAECEREVGRFAWEGTFADYLRMVTENSSLSSLSHKLVYDAVVAAGVEESPTGEPIYGLFSDEIYGMDAALDKIAQYLASSARRMEIRKRILLLLGPPASGKSSIIALIKQALERYTRSEAGVVYAIKGCPMQEEPLHLIPHQLRPKLQESYGIYIEGDLCPRCRYILHSEHNGKVSKMEVERVTFSEHEAVGIGYYVASNPNPTDASLLVGSVDTVQLEGDRQEVAGKAFRLDGEFNVANRGLIELVEIFKADRHLLTTLLGLSQEQLIKMERFGSVYADEVIVGHSNEGDYEEFKADKRSEALKDRMYEIRIPYNLKVRDEVKIYEKMLRTSGVEGIHLAPLTLSTMSTYAVLSRLVIPDRQAMGMLDKLHLYDGQMVPHFNPGDLAEMQRHHSSEGMDGISPRYVMNRLSTVASDTDVVCVSPLKALDSLWQGLKENVSLEEDDPVKHIGFVKDTVEDYGQRAILEVQRAFEERFDQTASELLSEYLDNVQAYSAGAADRSVNERGMKEMEKHIRISDRERDTFRQEIQQLFTNLKNRNVPFDYTSEPRMKAAIEARLFPDHRKVERALSRPRLARHQAEWARRRGAIFNRLVDSYGYCSQCAEDTIEFVVHVLKGSPVLKSPKNEGIDWQWDLNPTPPPAAPSE